MSAAVIIELLRADPSEATACTAYSPPSGGGGASSGLRAGPRW
jgi:hypothetical protein